MLRLGIALCVVATCTLAQDFKFAIGNPVASGDFMVKSAIFVFRTEGCEDPAKLQVSAAAEGLVKGTRRSVVLKVTATVKPGVFAVYQSWPAEGDWVVNLKGTCGSASAGAIVPVGPKGFVRESAKFLSRPASDSEIEAALKARTQGEKQ